MNIFQWLLQTDGNVVGLITVHWPYGLFMNWYGNQKGEGFEYHLLVLMAIALIIVGGGAWSLDSALAGPR